MSNYGPNDNRVPEYYSYDDAPRMTESDMIAELMDEGLSFNDAQRIVDEYVLDQSDDDDYREHDDDIPDEEDFLDSDEMVDDEDFE